MYLTMVGAESMRDVVGAARGSLLALRHGIGRSGRRNRASALRAVNPTATPAHLGAVDPAGRASADLKTLQPLAKVTDALDRVAGLDRQVDNTSTPM